MPTLENTIPEISVKSLNRRASRSAIIWQTRKASYMGIVLPKLERAVKALAQSVEELSEPVMTIVGTGDKAQAVPLKDYAQQAKTALALASVADELRSLLGFPSPGRRKDEQSAEKRTSDTPVLVETVAEQSPVQSPVQSENVASDAPSNAPSDASVPSDTQAQAQAPLGAS